jgi:hypothetical protein
MQWRDAVTVCVVITAAGGGCAGDVAGPTRIDFEVAVSGAGQTALHETAGARPIRLDSARLHLGALSFYAGESVWSARALLDDWLSFSSAYAHPGHVAPGEALADTGPVGPVDLIGSEVTPTVVHASGQSGAYGTMTVALVGGETLTLGGAIVGADREVPFTARIDLGSDVEGIVCDIDAVTGMRLRMAIRVDEFVRRVDTDLLPIESEAPLDLGDAPQALSALERALSAPATYQLLPEAP